MKKAIRTVTRVAMGFVVDGLIDTALGGISNAEIKAASATWVSTINDWTPGIIGAGFVLCATMFFINKYSYALGALGGTAFMFAAKKLVGTGEGCLVDMAKELFL